jgi:hypothetical protein
MPVLLTINAGCLLKAIIKFGADTSEAKTVAWAEENSYMMFMFAIMSPVTVWKNGNIVPKVAKYAKIVVFRILSEGNPSNSGTSVVQYLVKRCGPG